jgi:hypothetical protein
MSGREMERQDIKSHYGAVVHVEVSYCIRDICIPKTLAHVVFILLFLSAPDGEAAHMFHFLQRFERIGREVERKGITSHAVAFAGLKRLGLAEKHASSRSPVLEGEERGRRHGALSELILETFIARCVVRRG